MFGYQLASLESQYNSNGFLHQITASAGLTSKNRFTDFYCNFSLLIPDSVFFFSFFFLFTKISQGRSKEECQLQGPKAQLPEGLGEEQQ